MGIRQRITEGYDLEAAQVHFVLQYLFDLCYSTNDGQRLHIQSITCGLCYDDELEFVEEFAKRWPGRGSTTGARARLQKRLNAMSADHWIEKIKRYNDQHYIGEMRSGWYPAWKLFDSDARKLHDNVITIESLVHTYTGRLKL